MRTRPTIWRHPIVFTHNAAVRPQPVGKENSERKKSSTWRAADREENILETKKVKDKMFVFYSKNCLFKNSDNLFKLKMLQ